MSRIAVYPGTFDPITNGHVDIIKRASTLFDKVVVAVAPTSRKSSCLPWDERLQLVTEVVRKMPRVDVYPLKGLLVDFAKEHGASIILRGLRAVSDFDYEFQLAHMNAHLCPEIETVFIPASESCSYISGTLVREIVGLGGDVLAFVPAIVAEHFQRKRK